MTTRLGLVARLRVIDALSPLDHMLSCHLKNKSLNVDFYQVNREEVMFPFVSLFNPLAPEFFLNFSTFCVYS